MRRWSVVFGILLGLHMAWTQPGWAQGGFVPTLTPGDVGTQACREVQLAVQGEVGNETNPPYKNHGQYVRAATNAANPALQAGEITEACHSCIVSQFARSIPIGDQESCGPDLCEVSGGPGWENMVHPGGGVVNLGNITPQACCQACVANPDCAQWSIFLGSCQLNVPPTGCANPITATPNGGIIRCPAP